MVLWRWLRRQIRTIACDESFLSLIGGVEAFVSKTLSLGMIIIILMAVLDLGLYLFNELVTHPYGRFSDKIFEVFGLFLNILIALELLENITAYLKKHVVQLELVIVTSLIAVSRKIIILDLEKTGGLDLIALAAAILALSTSYWLIRRVTPPPSSE